MALKVTHASVAESMMVQQIGPREAQLRAQREKIFTQPQGRAQASPPAQPKRKTMAKAKPMPPKGGKGSKKGSKGC